MSASASKQAARLRYDTSTGELMEVTFSYEPQSVLPGGYIEISYDMAVSILDGSIRMIDYVVTLDDQSDLVLMRKGDVEYKRMFWELCNAESSKSPVMIFDKSHFGFSVKLSRITQRFLIYVTELNDPNKLLTMIKSWELGINAAKEIRCDLNISEDYSIYVRNHVT